MYVVFTVGVCTMVGVVIGIPTSADVSQNEVTTLDFSFVTRSQWKAREPTERQALNTPVPYVVIHHSYMPAACHSLEECSKAMRSMQNYHMDEHKWWDIGYHFAVGSEGSAYEGRGWNVLGAHALHFNTVSIGICLIGDWRDELPPPEQLKTTKALIATGVELGYISPNYKLVGHRQVRETECPGGALYKEIQSWPHYAGHPSSVQELILVDEIPERIKAILRNKTSTN